MKWLKRLFIPWRFIHTVTPSQANKVKIQFIRNGYEAKVAVIGTAYGVMYRKC